jgi:hypothetical protein
MAIQTINIGNQVNDGLGDDLRTAFQKVNANFTSLAEELTITVADATSSGESLFKQKTGSTLEFKTLSAGSKISLNSTTDTITINNTTNDAFERFITDAGNITSGVGNPRAITLEGIAAPGSVTSRKDIEVTSNGTDRVYFKTVIPVTDILTSYDFGPISNTFTNTMQLALSGANIDFGIIQFDELGNETPSSALNLDCGGILYATDTQSYTVNFAAPQAIVALNSITADGNVTTAEALGTIPISGTVTGTMPDGSSVVGQSILITINRVQYTTTVATGGTFTVDVAGTDLLEDADKVVDVRLSLVPIDPEDLNG